MNLSNKLDDVINILSKIDIAYKEFEKRNLVRGDWVIVGEDIYNKYKNKITISNINYISEPEIEQAIPTYPVTSLKLTFETKKYYGALKYNINFIAYNISEREYSALVNPMSLIAVNRNLQNNYNKNIIKPPKLLDILKVIDWKITAKAKKEIKEKVNFIDYKE
jgi:hypothetical protein